MKITFVDMVRGQRSTYVADGARVAQDWSLQPLEERWGEGIASMEASSSVRQPLLSDLWRGCLHAPQHMCTSTQRLASNTIVKLVHWLVLFGKRGFEQTDTLLSSAVSWPVVKSDAHSSSQPILLTARDLHVVSSNDSWLMRSCRGKASAKSQTSQVYKQMSGNSSRCREKIMLKQTFRSGMFPDRARSALTRRGRKADQVGALARAGVSTKSKASLDVSDLIPRHVRWQSKL